jgi:hypothetical protein
VVIFIALLAGFVPLLQVTFFALLEDFYLDRLAAKDRDKTNRITGVILIMWYQITGFITASVFCWMLDLRIVLFPKQFSDQKVKFLDWIMFFVDNQVERVNFLRSVGIQACHDFLNGRSFRSVQAVHVIQGRFTDRSPRVFFLHDFF